MVVDAFVFVWRGSPASKLKRMSAMKRAVPPTRISPAAQNARIRNLDITVLAGGASEEREVSLVSGKKVAAALAVLGHRVTLSDVSPQSLSALSRPANMVFVALHGSYGEDGGIQAELEKRGLLFTGTGSIGSAAAMDKVRAKSRFIEVGLPTPRFEVARSFRIAEVVSHWRLPVVVKPISSGSSVDTHIVRDRARFHDAIMDVAKKHGQALIEEMIEGPEITVGILGDQALPPIQVRTSREFYDYQAKYIDDGTDYLFDIDLTPQMLERIQVMSLRASASLGCRDFCRVDWMVDAVTHEPFLLEVNTIPGFTNHSLLPKAAARAGLSFADLCQNIVELTMARGRCKSQCGVCSVEMNGT